MIVDDIESILSLSAKLADGENVLNDPWSDRHSRYNAFKYKEEIYTRLILELTNALNKHHGVDYSVRYWTIICGPWLRQFINRIHHFWSCLEKIDDKKAVNLEVPNLNFEDVVPQSIVDYNVISRTRLWNQFVIGEIASRIGITLTRTEDFAYAKETPQEGPKQSIVNKIIITLIKSLRILGKKEVVLLSTNCNWFLKLKLMIKLRETLYFVDENFKLPLFVYNHELRHDLSQVFQSGSFNSKMFEKCLVDMIALNLPKSYLEGYDDIKKLANHCGLPDNPKVILATWTIPSEIFKIYAATKIENGSKLCLLSHGNECHLYSDFHNHELEVCDRYFTWGWIGHSAKHFLGFCQHTNKKVKTTGKEFSLLLILTEIQRHIEYLASVPSYEQYIKEYISDQIDFISFLDPSLLSILNVRLAENHSSAAKEKIEKQFPELRFSYRNEDLNKLTYESKILVISYNQTSLIQALVANKPTVVFFRRESHEMSSPSDDVYKALQACGIFHDTPFSAAKQINEVWNDVDIWWQSPQVRLAVSMYCEKFGRESKTPTKDVCEFIKF
jgi:putative transferase (TIGR04331 family)